MTITLELPESVVEGLRADAAEQELSLEAHLEALLTDWHLFRLPATDAQMTALLARHQPPAGYPLV